MAIDRRLASVITGVVRSGKTLGRTLTVGRQNLFVPLGEVNDLLRSAGRPTLETAEVYSEPFLRQLGGTTVESIDASSFEGATMVHDLNEPIPAGLYGQYDTIIDGGSLEHVWNAPVALRSLVLMLARDGVLVLSGPCNNQCGHGYVQFSPAFFHDFLSAAGFQVRTLVHRVGPFGGYYSPNEDNPRVELMTILPYNVLVLARKVRELSPAEIGAIRPSQRLYRDLWETGNPYEPMREARTSWVVRFMKAGRTAVQFLLGHSVWSREQFKRVTPQL